MILPPSIAGLAVHDMTSPARQTHPAELKISSLKWRPKERLQP